MKEGIGIHRANSIINSFMFLVVELLKIIDNSIQLKNINLLKKRINNGKVFKLPVITQLAPDFGEA